MQREKEGRDNLSRDPLDRFRAFGLFGSPGNMMPSLFGGSDLFEDPFFTRPFGSMFESSVAASTDKLHNDKAKGVTIEELNSDEERDEDEISEDERIVKQYRSSREPSVEHPDDVVDGRNSINKLQHVPSNAGTNTRSYSVQTCKVTYGGIDGAYYTSTRTRSADNDGVVLEETKEADRTTGQATHRISRGIHDKGHSVTRKLNSDGKVDTLQTLHNLSEGELANFEESWNVKGRLPVSRDGADMHGNKCFKSTEQNVKSIWGGRSLAYMGQSGNGRGTGPDAGRSKKVVRINIE